MSAAEREHLQITAQRHGRCRGLRETPSSWRSGILVTMLVYVAAISGCDGFQNVLPTSHFRSSHISSPSRPTIASISLDQLSAWRHSERTAPVAKPQRPSPCVRAYGGGGDYYRPPRRKLRYGRRRRFGGGISVQRLLVGANVFIFLLQVRSAVLYLPALNSVLTASGYGGQPLGTIDILQQMAVGSSPIAVTGRPPISLGSQTRAYGQALVVASSVGPFTMDFVHQTLLTRLQPHRLLTAGFLHGSLVHLIFNMRYLWTMPRWLEDGLGWPLYLSAYIFSTLTGNLAHSYVASTGSSVLSLCLGSSGGICGLNGLYYVMLKKMGNKLESRQVFKNMLWLVLFGSVTEGISNAGHIGGFLGGAAVGLLFGPNYGKSYAHRRKWSVAVDKATPDYRRVMGFGVEPKNGMLPLWYLWAAVGLGLWARPDLRFVPECILRGIRNPGALSGMRMIV